MDQTCEQRKLRMKYNNPFPRFTLTSPYTTNLSMFDFNMRRKVEILKYNKSTQSNGTSKKSNYARVMTSNYNKRSIDASNECGIVKTWTTNSDVPGRPMLLYEDPTIPLYMHGNNSRSYVDQTYTDVSEYEFVPNVTNYPLSSTAIYEHHIATLLIRQGILSSLNKISYTIPIYVNISGENLISGSNGNINIELKNINLIAKLGLIEPPASMFTQSTMNRIITVTNINQPFKAIIYMGSVVFNNLEISTVDRNAYKLNIKIQKFSTTNDANGTHSNLTSSAIFNKSDDGDKFVNCSSISSNKPTYIPIEFSL